MMIIHPAKPLFDWGSLEDSPSLQTIKDLLAALPDGKLLDSLRFARGKGRNDYPVHVLWGVVVLRVALRHVSTEAVLAELRRNEGLRRLIGIESERGVPKAWNISRFEDVLGQEPHRTLLKEVFNVLIQRLVFAKLPGEGHRWRCHGAVGAAQEGRALPGGDRRGIAAGQRRPQGIQGRPRRGDQGDRMVRLQTPLAGGCET